VSAVWQYSGLSARDIEQRLVYTHERTLTTTVNNIQHIESTSYDGIGVVKIFFQPGVSPDGAVAEVTAVSQTILKQLPPGTTPPLIIQYNASTVPIFTIRHQQQVAFGATNLRPGDETRFGWDSSVFPGVGIPYPYGGKQTGGFPWISIRRP